MTKKVLISGAGIAGSSLAYWLRRHGFAPTVVERAPALRDGGYKVDIRGAALDVVRRMGLLDEIRALKTDVRSAFVVDATGRKVASMDADTFGGRAHGDAEILRGDLARLMYERTRDDVTYRFGDSIESIEDGLVTFHSGHTETFDIIVGADGLHSRTRALAFGAEEQFVRDLGYHVSICAVPNHLGIDREELTYVGAGRTTLVYSTARDTDAKAMFLFRTPSTQDSDPRRALRAAYADQGWEVPRLLDAVDAAPDLYYDTLSQVRMETWSTGRVVLLGDAAYCASPASGQGTSLALVGAYVLAGELAKADGSHGTAFAAYEQRMRPFVAVNQKLGPDNIKRMVLGSKGQVRMSMVMLGLMAKMPGRERILAKVMEPLHRAATAIDLPDYGNREAAPAEPTA
jgi:2-polyprenyl-6-methoxyphenol hydroxylase-like FAD-dependent oxidoreductase